MTEMVSLDELKRLYDQHTELMAGAFLADVASMTRNIDMQAVRDAVERNDALAIVDLLHVDEGHLNRTMGALGAYYAIIGRRSIDSIRLARRPPKVVKQLDIQFALSNPRAQRWVETATTAIFRHIRLNQIEAVQAVLSEGLRIGAHPWQTALNLAGRIGPTGYRTGGVIGFGEMHQRWFDNFVINLGTQEGREYLYDRASEFEEIKDAAGNVVERRRRYKRRYNLINKSSWTTLGKAVNEFRDLTDRERDRLIKSYHNNVMLYRGRAIARTEMQGAQNAAQNEAVLQMVDKGALNRNRVFKRWKAGLDDRTRDDHVTVNGQTKQIDQDFVMPDGSRGQYCCAMTLSARQRINCRCYVQYDLPFVESVERFPQGFRDLNRRTGFPMGAA